MKKIYNSIHSFRNKTISSNLYNSYLMLHYYLRNYLGALRGCICSASGKIYYEKFRPLVIGFNTKFLMEHGSAIILNSSSTDKPNFINNEVFPSASTIGTYAHYNLLNPPSLTLTRIDLGKNAKLILSQNTIVLTGSYLSVSNNAELHIGENSYISQEVRINCRNKILIGKNVLIGAQVAIMDYDGHPIYDLNKKSEQPDKYNSGGKSKPVSIGDNVWIGFRSTILKGITIGEGSIIAANTNVTKDVPPNCMVGGNPAKILRENVTWER